MNIVKQIKKELLIANNQYILESNDGYNFWKEHIKLVYKNAIKLAKQYNANLEIVALGALLHDIALVKKIGTKKEHNVVGAEIAKQLLENYNYPEDLSNKVIKCVLNHRSSKNATSKEELCVADADIMAHFFNLNMIVNNAKRLNSNVKDTLNHCYMDFDDLSDSTKPKFEKYYLKAINKLEKLLIKANLPKGE